MSDQLRRAILDSGLSIYAVAKGSGVSQPVVARFVAGERDIRMETADRLFAFFRMQATAAKPPAR
ncbi:MAG TPA: helix-turn-helix transcriptional regulator [Pirellulales bacterium]|nr:helix-turn-helix transcriptional regulator [Pirellulales bacterium]